MVTKRDYWSVYGLPLLCVLCILFLSPVFIIWTAVYLGLSLILKLLVLTDRDHIMLPADSIWVRQEEKNRTIINAVAILDGNAPCDVFRRIFTEKVFSTEHKARFFKLYSQERCYAWIYYWQELLGFDIRDYVTEHPGVISSNAQHEILSHYVSQPLIEGASPWQMIIFRLDDGRTMTLYRFKHSVADGIALLRLFMEHLTDEPVYFRTPNGHHQHPPVNMVQTLWSLIQDMPALWYNLLLDFQDINPFHGDKLSGQKRVAWSKPLPFNLIKRIKNKQDATVNDVLVACICDALARVKSTEEKVSLFTAFIPVSTHAPAEELHLTNSLGLIPVHLDLSPRVSVMDHLQDTKAVFERMKHNNRPLATSIAQKIITSCLPDAISQPLYDFIVRKGTAVFSNLPGPQEPMFMTKARVTDLFYFVPSRSTLGLGVSMLSYADNLRIAVIIDTAIYDKPEVICEKFVESVQALGTMSQ